MIGTETSITKTGIREEAIRLAEQLKDDSSWEDLMYQIYVRQAIETGLADCEAGRTLNVEEVRERFGLER